MLYTSHHPPLGSTIANSNFKFFISYCYNLIVCIGVMFQKLSTPALRAASVSSSVTNYKRRHNIASVRLITYGPAVTRQPDYSVPSGQRDHYKPDFINSLPLVDRIVPLFIEQILLVNLCKTNYYLSVLILQV